MFRTLSLFAALTLVTVPALAADDKPKTDRPRIKVFPLKNVAPADAVQAFNDLIGPANGADHSSQLPTPAPINPPIPLPNLPPPAPIPPQGPSFEIGEQPVAFVDEIYLNPYSTAQPPTPGAQAPVRALADPRTRSLIVRGTEKELQLAADLVAVLDTPEDKPLPAVKLLKAFRLQHLDPVDFAAMMHALDNNITYRMATVGRTKMLLAVGSDEQMKELADAIKELDIPAATM